MNHGPLWSFMNAQPSTPIGRLCDKCVLPTEPGVYALYRGRDPVYVGKAGSLRQRIWRNHCGSGKVMTGSAFRRNVAEFLGIAAAADIKARRYQPSLAELSSIRVWIEACDLRWIICDTEPDACDLEQAMKRERRPPLTKR